MATNYRSFVRIDYRYKPKLVFALVIQKNFTNEVSKANMYPKTLNGHPFIVPMK